MSPPPPASKKAHVVQFAAGATVDGGSAAAKIRARAQFSDDGTSSSAAIAEDRSVKSHYVLNSVIDVALGKGNLGEEEEEEDTGPAQGPGAGENSRTASHATHDTNTEHDFPVGGPSEDSLPQPPIYIYIYKYIRIKR